MLGDAAYKLGTNGKYYFGHQAIAAVDAATFEVLNHIWARDAKRVYAFGQPLRKADRASFEVLNPMFARDGIAVHSPSGVIKGADARSFEVLDAGHYEYARTNAFGDTVHEESHYLGYARDKASVYLHVYTYATRLLKNVDRNSFEVMKFGYARDECRVYFEGTQIKKANPARFEQIGRLWGRDDWNAYYGTSPIAGADAATFRLVSDDDFLTCDSSHYYKQKERIAADELVRDPAGKVIGWPLVSGLRLGIAKVTQYLDAGANPRLEPQALTLACHYHDLAMVKLLLGFGADPNARCLDDVALTYACYNAEPMPIIQLLLDAGAEINVRGNRPPLLAALMAGKWELAEYLVRRGADVNAPVGDNPSLLEYARFVKHARVIQFLQDHGAV